MTYIGTKPVDLNTLEPYNTYTPAQWAMYWISRFSGIDGSHHKDWIIDQIARILKGGEITAYERSWTNHISEYDFSVSESEEYTAWVLDMKGQCVDGEFEYDYSVGIAP